MLKDHLDIIINIIFKDYHNNDNKMVNNLHDYEMVYQSFQK